MSSKKLKMKKKEFLAEKKGVQIVFGIDVLTDIDLAGSDVKWFGIFSHWA